MIDLAQTQTVSAHGPDGSLGSLLCVGAFPSNVGFAWDFIESLYAGVADRLAQDSVATWVAYPALPSPPRSLEGSAARGVKVRIDFGRVRSVRDLIRFVKARDVRVLYMADQPAWHPAYALLRLAGVRWIVVHDHASGERTSRAGILRAAKRLSRAVPGMLADRVIAVSDFVARRLIEVSLVPDDRVVRIWNAIKAPDDPSAGVEAFLKRFELPRDRPLVVCAARATREKGIHHLLKAFDRALAGDDLDPRPLLAYMGDGPFRGELESLRQTLAHRDDIRMLGYVSDAGRFLGAASICVVPSVWQEAFGLAALEPMACGVPVIASAVGGLPEVVLDGETGVLVPPGDEEAIATAMRELLSAPDRRSEMGRRARRRAMEVFNFRDEVESVYRVVATGFGIE